MQDDDGNFFSNLPFYSILSDKKEGRKQLTPPPNIQLSFTVQLGFLATAGVPALNLYTLLSSGGGVGVGNQVRKQRIKKMYKHVQPENCNPSNGGRTKNQLTHTHRPGMPATKVPAVLLQSDPHFTISNGFSAASKVDPVVLGGTVKVRGEMGNIKCVS